MRSSNTELPLVSVIVPTCNSAAYLHRCLDSIKQQTYRNLELIIIDNNSSDCTRDIALQYTSKVFIHGPERSAQVNYGVEIANGTYVYKVDSDFVLEPSVIEQCVDKAVEGYHAVVVHNTPDTEVSWIAKIRKFETDMYKFDLNHASARFLERNTFNMVGGFDINLIAGEDYDFQNRLNRFGVKTGFIAAEAVHLGEPEHILPLLLKYFWYGQDFIHYKLANPQESRTQLRFFRKEYFKHWRGFAQHPFIGIAFIFYNCLKYLAGALGFLFAKLRSK